MKITAIETRDAINIAIHDPEIGQALKHRDQDPNIDCVYIRSGVISAPGEEIREYEVWFNYQDVDKKPLAHADIKVRLNIHAGGAAVTFRDFTTLPG